MPIEAISVIQSAMGDPGSFAETLVLRGLASGGETFFSDSLDVRGVNYGTDGNTIEVSAGMAKIVVRCSQPAQTPRMTLWFRGFKSYRNPVVSMSLGLVEVVGSAKKATVDDVSGHVSVQAAIDTDRP